MTPDQYRREGAEAMRERAANVCAEYPRISPGYAEWKLYDAQINHSVQNILAIDVDEVLAKVRTRCAECDCEDGNCTWIKADQVPSSSIEMHGWIDDKTYMELVHPNPSPIARLVEAAQALGAMPEGYCFCSANRVGDDSKIHEPECADLRAALAAMEASHD